MNFKVKFQQVITGTETCEATIEADNQTEALEKFNAREFSRYLVVDRETETYVNEEEVSFDKVA